MVNILSAYLHFQHKKKQTSELTHSTTHKHRNLLTLKRILTS